MAKAVVECYFIADRIATCGGREGGGVKTNLAVYSLPKFFWRTPAAFVL
jgi:hypothetical protein